MVYVLKITAVCLLMIMTMHLNASNEHILYIIVNKDNHNRLNDDELYNIFVGKQLRYKNNEKIVFVLPPPDSQARVLLIKHFLKMSESRFSRLWARSLFTGKTINPKEVASEEEAIDIVKQNLNALSVVAHEFENTHIRILKQYDYETIN